MSLPATYDLEFYREDTPRKYFRLQGDLTAMTAKMQIRATKTNELLADLSASVTATLEPMSGSTPAKTSFRFRGLSLAEATAIKATNALYDFQLTNGTTWTRTYLRGRVYVELDISR